MIFPDLPLTASVKEVLDFCLTFRTFEGFVAVYEEKQQELGKKYRHDGLSGAAYEATEILHKNVFGHRRYDDREVFWNALARHRRRKGKK